MEQFHFGSSSQCLKTGGGNEQHLPSAFGEDQIKEEGEEGLCLPITRGLPQGSRCSLVVFFMWLLHSCATLQCRTFEETIIADRAQKEAERRKREQDAMELKSILKVKGSEAEAALLHHQLGVNYLHHRFCSSSKWSEKVGWCEVVQTKDRFIESLNGLG